MRLAAVCIGLLWAGAAQAQGLSLSLCRAITTDKERLACFDQLSGDTVQLRSAPLPQSRPTAAPGATAPRQCPYPADMEDEFIADGVTVVCTTPGAVRDGYRALGDPSWMREIGCVQPREGIRLLRLSGISERYSSLPERFRMFIPDGDSVTVYAHNYMGYLKRPPRPTDC